jgi:hypothetical protein
MNDTFATAIASPPRPAVRVASSAEPPGGVAGAFGSTAGEGDVTAVELDVRCRRRNPAKTPLGSSDGDVRLPGRTKILGEPRIEDRPHPCRGMMRGMAAAKTFKTTIYRDGSMCFIPVPFDPKPVFGKVRAPVTVTLNGYSYRSTIAAMGGTVCIPLRRSNREAAGLEGGETLNVKLELDAAKREVEPPKDLVKSLKAAPPAWDRWRELSFSHQREYVEAIEEAKKPETRARRIEGAVRAVAARPAKARERG